LRSVVRARCHPRDKMTASVFDLFKLGVAWVQDHNKGLD
jgi:hypothetical protein